MIDLLLASSLLLADAALYRPTTTGPFISYTAILTPKRHLLLQPIISVVAGPDLHDDSGAIRRAETGTIVTMLSLFAELGLNDWLTVGSQLSVLSTHASRDGRSAQSTNLGDLQVFSRVRLLSEQADGRPELVLFGQLKLPTGKADNRVRGLMRTDITGSGSTDVTLGLNVTKGLRPVLLHADVMYTHLFVAHLDGETVQYGELFNWSVAAEWLFFEPLLALVVEVAGRHQTPRFVSGVMAANSTVHELNAGIGLEIIVSESMQLVAGYQRTIWGKNAVAANAAVASVLLTL